MEPGCGWFYETYGAFKYHYYVYHGLHLHEDAEKVYLTEGYVKVERSVDRYADCSICGRKVIKQFRAHHVKNHRKMKHMYKCPEQNCAWMYENYTTLRSHCIKNHGLSISNDKTVYVSATQRSRRIDCKICGRRLLRAHHSNHVKRHCKMKYKCSKCGWMFERHLSLQSHLDKVHRKDISTSAKHKSMVGRPPKIHKNEGTRPAVTEMINRYTTHTNNTSELCQKRNKKNLSATRRKEIETKSVQLRGTSTGDSLICCACTRRFESTTDCKRHTERHSFMRYKCKHASCGWMFEYFYMLQWHYSMDHVPELTLDRTTEKTITDTATLDKDTSNENNSAPYEPQSMRPTYETRQEDRYEIGRLLLVNLPGASQLEQQNLPETDSCENDAYNKPCQQVKVEKIEKECNSTGIEIVTPELPDFKQEQEYKQRKLPDDGAEEKMANNQRIDVKIPKTDPDLMCQKCNASVGATENLQQQTNENEWNISMSEYGTGLHENFPYSLTVDSNANSNDQSVNIDNTCSVHARAEDPNRNTRGPKPIVIMPRDDFQEFPDDEKSLMDQNLEDPIENNKSEPSLEVKNEGRSESLGLHHQDISDVQSGTIKSVNDSVSKDSLPNRIIILLPIGQLTLCRNVASCHSLMLVKLEWLDFNRGRNLVFIRVSL